MSALAGVLLLGGSANAATKANSVEIPVQLSWISTATEIALVGPEACLDKANPKQECFRASTAVAMAEGDVTGHGTLMAMGMTAEGVRTTQALVRLVISDSPCGTGSVTIETRAVYPVCTPVGEIPTTWRLLPEQGSGDLAGISGEGTQQPAAKPGIDPRKSMSDADAIKLAGTYPHDLVPSQQAVADLFDKVQGGAKEAGGASAPQPLGTLVSRFSGEWHCATS